ncbi:MAG: hypothetical protein JXA64_08390 [Candidatus Fermentibacteraceae bacterium]|nr:hypothetical protein [Candidatus Fermentibacteraceae bacterium]MBN2609119.1 hypothetical protein [Candidatus Fermentibacteraceae bacterium]
MRIDVFLKLTGIFRTRSSAGKAASAGYVSMDGRKLKSSHSVGRGDVLHIVKPDGTAFSIRVEEIPENRQVSRRDRQEYFTILGDPD